MKINTTGNFNRQTQETQGSAEFEAVMKNAQRKTVTIPKIEGQDDVLECCINGYNILLKRGVEIELPENVIELLNSSEII